MRSVLFVFFAASFGSSWAQTEISGGIFSDATWTLAGSPYHITDDVVVFEPYVLTIDPGVVVQVDAGKTIELRNSVLRAIGTAEAPIRFEKAGAGRWGGFVVQGTVTPFSGNQVRMEHCIGSGADWFMNLDIAYHTPYAFISCEFAENEVAVGEGVGSYFPGNYAFEQCTFRDNWTALYHANGYDVIDCEFTGNEQAIMGASSVTGSTFTDNVLALEPAGIVDGNTFTGNTTAVLGQWAGEDNIFTNNTIVANGTGIRMGDYFNSSVQFTGNRICDNTLWNIERYAAFSNNTADLSGNCFCATDPQVIESTIHHAVDDLDVGLIVFTPFLTSAECVDFNLTISEDGTSGLSIHPNPASERLIVTLPTAMRNGTVFLYDPTGRMVQRVSVSSSSMHVGVAELPNGVYRMVLHSNEAVLARSVVVAH